MLQTHLRILRGGVILLLAFACSKDKVDFPSESGSAGSNGLVFGTDEAIYYDFESEQITVLGDQLCNP